MRYDIKDLDEHELGRATDARSASQLIEARWPGAVVVSPEGVMVYGWMNLPILLPEAEDTQIFEDDCEGRPGHLGGWCSISDTNTSGRCRKASN